MPSIFASNASALLLNGEPVDGVQTLAFRTVTEREDVRALGSNERIDVAFGLRVVQGEVVVKSHSATLDGHLDNQTRFSLLAVLKKDKGLQDNNKREYAFDGCFVEGKHLRIDAGGVAVTTYTFSATRVGEK